MLLHRTLILHCAFLAAAACAPSALYAAPLAITRIKNLTFGQFVGGGGVSGTVTVDTAGGRSSSGSVRLLSGETFSPAEFVVSGNPGTRYTLTLPATVVLSSGSAQASVSQLTTSIPITGLLPAGGSTTLLVGGTLSVGTSQVNGVYSGSLSVSVTK